MLKGSARFQYLINRDFQLKYTTYLVTSAIMSALIVGGPTYYFLHQNYDIFLSLAYSISPDIVQHLAQEERWITGFFIFSLMTLLIFHFYFGIRLTFRMVGPLLALRRHMMNTTKGNLRQKPLHIRQEDEFHDLIQHYNYLYKTLRAQNSFDIKKLENIRFYLKDQNGMKAIDDMIQEKEAQISASSLETSKSPDSHLAS